METTFVVNYNNRIILTAKSKYQFDNKGAGHMIFTHLQKYSDKPLQIHAETGEIQTYGEVLERSIRIALKLQDIGIKIDKFLIKNLSFYTLPTRKSISIGIKPNDAVLICSINHINSCIPVFASLFIGAHITGFDTKMHLNEASVLMDQLNPKIMFVDLQALDFIQSLLQSSRKSALIIVFGSTFNHINFFDLLSPHSDEKVFTPVAVKETDIACIVFTTGSTGIPKGACINHRAFLTRIAAYTECNDLSQRSLLFASWYWTVNYSYWASIVFQGGCRILLELSDNPQLFWKAITLYKPTHMLMTPFEMRILCESQSSDANADSFQKVLICGASFSNQELTKYKEIFRNSVVIRGYGLTEDGLILDFPYLTKKDLERVNKKPTSIGTVLPGISYKVVDVDTTRALGPFQKGELLVKTASVLNGYYKKESNEIFDDDGWLKTGDIVYYDEDFYFYYEDRLKEYVKYRYWHVPLRLIENALISRDDVTDACVIGIPHEFDEEHPVAIIKLKDASRYEDIQKDICNYTEKLFGDHWKLRGVKIVDEIPITPNGKYDIRKIKSQFF